MLDPMTASSPRDPWFRRQPALAVGVAALLYAAVFTLRLLTGDAADAYSMLYALPVALVASAYGMRAGLLAGVLAVGLIGLWTVLADISLTPSGWLSRALPLLLLGALLGQATDQALAAETERRELEAAALLHREAIEINDSLIQGMAAAKWTLESGQLDAGLRILETTIAEAHELVSRLIRRAEMGDRTEPVER
jgi:hypothetical protein